jgi:hypothetical protein
MNKKAIIVLTMVFLAVSAFSAPFKVGEDLEFTISWNELVKAGTASLKVQGVKMFNGHKVYHVVSTAQSGEYLDSFFYVRDRVECYIDTETYATWKAEKHLVEGDYRHDEVIYYNPEERISVRGTNTLRALPDAMDALTGFYYVRSLDMNVGDIITINFCDGKLNKELTVKVLKKETVEVPAGTFDTIKIEPIMEETEGIFKAEGRIWIWVTDDEKKMPVMLKSKIVIGDFVAELEEYTLSS